MSIWISLEGLFFLEEAGLKKTVSLQNNRKFSVCQHHCSLEDLDPQ